MRYFLLFFLVTCFTFSQDLYVSNGSYVYVDGSAFTSDPAVAPLYVTNDVNLDVNGHIYLRNDAQLLQGDNGSSLNSGLGQLSVYQTGTVNTYAYNYWSSPVGNTTLDNTNNSAFIPNNNIYDYIGTGPILDPITSVLATYTVGYDGVATAAPTPQVISSFWLYTYDAGILYSEWDALGEAGSLDSGYGFTMKGNPSGGQQYDFRGKPNNGNITVAVEAGKETLVGNPYPSALDAQAFIHDPLNAGYLSDYSAAVTTGVLKYWEQAPGATSHALSSYVGGYALYTISAGGVESFTAAPFTTYLLDGTPTNVPFGAGTKVAKRYIPVGQGFMIEGAITGNVSFTNSQRTFYKQSGADSYFFRTRNNKDANNNDETEYTEDGLNIVPPDFKRFRINVDFAENEFYTRQLLMNFHNTATNGFDYGLEANNADVLDSDAYWVLDNEPYVIQAFEYDISLRIPLVVNVENNMPIRFRIFDIQNFDDNQQIYFHDIESGIYLDLREQDYNINLPSGSYNNRFEITFTSESLGIESFTIDDFIIYQDNTESLLYVLNPKQLDIKQIALYGISGKQVLNHTNLKSQDNYQFSTENLSDGVYVAKISLSSGQDISKKVIVANKN